MSPADLLLEEILKQSGQTLPTESTSASASAIDTNDFTRYVSESCRNVFSTMCMLELSEGVTVPVDDIPHGHEVLSTIQLSGGANATIRLSASREIILDAAATALGDRPENIDADVKDFIGELSNMIGGNTKKKLGKSDISLGLPQVAAKASEATGPPTCGVAITWNTDQGGQALHAIEFDIIR